MERLNELYLDWSGCKADRVELLPLSGSARKYYRITGQGGTCIGCIGTTLSENKAFLEIDSRFRASGLHAPEVYSVSPEGMCYIQEDLGDGGLFGLLEPYVQSGDFPQELLDNLHDTIALLSAVQFKVAQGLDWDVCFPDREFNARMIAFD